MRDDRRILFVKCINFKAADLCSKLIRLGAEVHVMMTASAVKFISPLTFQALSKQPVKVDTFDEQDASVIAHIDLADRADVVVIAPATANLIGKMAHGLADDMLSTTLLAATSPVLVAPAMNVHMYDHPAVRHNMKLLEERGVRFIDPGVGQLACGYVGKGRMAEPEDIVEAIRSMLEPNLPLSGKKVLVTAGSTQERIDPVRYIGNDASGKTGFAIAQAARDLGAEVVLVSGPSTAEPPAGMELIRVMSAQDMFDAVLAEFADSDIIIKSAAVADYRPVETAKQKIKKQGDTLTLKLVKNPDILQTLGERKTNQFLVGFAAE
ncbi:MAG: phosphopantothenoylcysteine decarboxylase, partial [Paenibacillus sp. RIFOXYA1_FULL_44_5]